MHQTLISKVDFTPSDDWQHVVSRQDYGTFYCIYLKVLEVLRPDIKIKGNTSNQYSYKIKFHLQNFEGAVTVGISDVILRIPDSKQKNDEEDDFDFQFILSCKPFYANPQSGEIIVETKEELKSGKIVDFFVEMDFPPHDMYNPKNLRDSEYISPERHVRDGEEVFDIVVKERDGYGKHGTNKRCYQRRSKIM